MVSEKKMQKVAKTIVNVNFGIRPKDVVTISCGPKSLKFAEALAYECAMKGAQPMIGYGSDELSLKIYKKINPKFLKFKPKLGWAHLKVVNAEMHIDESNPFVARQLPQKKIEIRRKAVKPLRRAEEKKHLKKTLKTALIGFPTEEDAKAIGIPFKKLEGIFWNTIDIDYEKLYRFNKKLVGKLKGVNKIRIVGKKTNLEFSIKSRRIFNACGIVTKKEEMGYLNLPDGEVFIAPIENSANGEIYFDLPCMYHYGKQVEGVWFKFKNGKVVKYKIDKGLKNFEDILKNASGEKFRIGEFAIGTNPKAKPTGGMIIVDEKVRGTTHMAIGHNKHFGGKNDSTIHWDFFKTMDRGSRLYADKKLIMKDGKFV
jgi:aminopeptidase